MNILVTGCNGQLGNEMQLLEKDNGQHVFFNTDVSQLDITDQAAVDRFVADHEIDCIVNCAAYTAVDRAESDRELCTTLNTVAPAYLAAAVERRGGAMIQVSTDYVFDGKAHTPYVETDTPSPDSVYGSTKLAGELAVVKFCRRTMIVRTAWLYSSFGNNFVKTMMRLGREKKELGVVFDQIGTPTYARDLAVAIMAAVNKGIVPGVYHFSNEGVCSWYDFACEIIRLSGVKATVAPCTSEEYKAKHPDSADRPKWSALDNRMLRCTVGNDVRDWKDALACFFAHWDGENGMKG